MKIWTMEEFGKLSLDEYIEFMPDAFLENPEGFCMKYGKTEYERLVNMVICTASCLIWLNNNDKLNYHESIYVYEPLLPKGADN